MINRQTGAARLFLALIVGSTAVADTKHRIQKGAWTVANSSGIAYLLALLSMVLLPFAAECAPAVSLDARATSNYITDYGIDSSGRRYPIWMSSFDYSGPAGWRNGEIAVSDSGSVPAGGAFLGQADLRNGSLTASSVGSAIFTAYNEVWQAWDTSYGYGASSAHVGFKDHLYFTGPFSGSGTITIKLRLRLQAFLAPPPPPPISNRGPGASSFSFYVLPQGAAPGSGNIEIINLRVLPGDSSLNLDEIYEIQIICGPGGFDIYASLDARSMNEGQAWGRITQMELELPPGFSFTSESGVFLGGQPSHTKIVPIVTWNAPSPIVHGTPLSTAQLNATANVPGTFSYSQPVGTILPPGRHEVMVTYVPLDTLNYENVSTTVSLNVIAATSPCDANLALVYSNNFSASPGAEWSILTRSVTPSGRAFLGRFTNNIPTLSLNNLPAHEYAVVDFDLFILQTWDGNGDFGWGPDVWGLNVDGEAIVRTTFCSGDLTWSRQSYPQSYPGGVFPAREGAVETNSLGYAPFDAVYHIRVAVPHAASSLTLAFFASGLGSLSDESWGLDNVVVRVCSSTTPNHAPIALDQAIETPANTALAVTLTGSDIDGNALGYAIATNPSHGSLSGAPPNLAYTPELNYTGQDSFTFTVNDGLANSAPATVSITVTAVNHSPIVRNDFFAISENTNVRFWPEDLTWNDTDPDGDALTLSGITAPAHGVMITNTDGSLTYRSASNYFGIESITYSVSDGHGGVASGVMTIDVKPLGTVLTWGENDYGQTGNGTITLSENAPVAAAALPEGRKIVAVSSGLRFTIAVDNAGDFWAWGNGQNGQLGNGAQTNSPVPVRVRTPFKLGITPVSWDRPIGWPLGIAAGGYHGIGLYEGVLFTWGLNSAGQLGDGTTQNRLSGNPIQLPGFRGPIAVAAGQYFSLALADDGTIWAWGLNVYGELGDGSAASIRSTPGQVLLPGGRLATSIAAGANHALALADDRTMWAWGLNNYGQLGDGTTVNRSTPVQVGTLSDSRKPFALAAGMYHSLATADDGTVWSWGDNIVGQLGRITAGFSGTPGQVLALPGNRRAKAIAAGQLHSMAMFDDGTIAAWGGNYQGQLGIASPNSSAPPTIVALPPNKRAVGLASGYMHSVALVQGLPDHPPVAVAGTDTNVLALANCEATIHLNGSGSYDPDGDAMAYTWVVFADDGTSLIPPLSGAIQNVTLPVGRYSARLTVSTSVDGKIVAVTDSLMISVLPNELSLMLNPSSGSAGGAGFNLSVTGGCFVDGATVYWNGTPRPTIRVSSMELVATIPSSDLDTGVDVATATVTVLNGDGGVSNPMSFAILGETVGTANSQIVDAGQTSTVSTSSTSGDTTVAVTLQNNGGDAISLLTATYDGVPVAGTAFRLDDGAFVDVQITGADSSDSATVLFYYPSAVVGDAEDAVALRYFDGTDWVKVLGAGGTLPTKDSTDNLDGTSSGGRFVVTLDNTSTPKITELSGTVFGMFDATPQIGTVVGPSGPIALGTPAMVSVPFAVVGDWAKARVTFLWDDGSQSIVTPDSASAASAAKTYTAPGVFTVRVRLTDAAGSSVEARFEYVVIYDPSAGFVTGGGWITSPAGAYATDAALSGKATFGFVSKYQKGGTVPTGETEFQLHFANFTFKSTSYQWLVVSGAKAQYKGSGTIKGSGDYGFLLTATDGQVSGGGALDKFRIKIWDKTTGATVYDNVPGAKDDLDAANPQAISGGSISIKAK